MRLLRALALLAGLWPAAALAGGSTPPGIVQSGTITPGHCAQFSAQGVAIDAGATCGTGTAGVIQSTGTAGQILVNGDTSSHTGATTYSLPATITSSETFSGTVNVTGTFETNGHSFSTTLPFAVTGSGAQTLFFGNSGVPWTYNFPQVSGNLAYQVGSLTNGHCLQASGTAGGIADGGAACNSVAFSALLSGTNTTAAMVVGTGASLAITKAPSITSTTFGPTVAGIVDTMTPSGTATSSTVLGLAQGNVQPKNYFNCPADTVDGTAITGNPVDVPCVAINEIINGTSQIGARSALSLNVTISGRNGPAAGILAGGTPLIATLLAEASEGGTNTSPLGTSTGAGIQVENQAAASYYFNIFGQEIDVSADAGSAPYNKAALALAAGGNDADHAPSAATCASLSLTTCGMDSGLALYRLGASGGFNYGISFGGFGNNSPVTSGGTLIWAGTGVSANDLIDFSNATCSGAAFVAPAASWYVDCAGTTKTNITGLSQCIQANSGGVLGGTAAACVELNVNNTFTAGQAVQPGAGGTQSPGGTYTMNFAVANSFSATFGAGNLTIANPTNVQAAQEGCLALTQDSVGGRTASWGANFKWPSGVPPTLSTAANATDLVCWHAVSPTFVGGQLTMAALQ